MIQDRVQGIGKQFLVSIRTYADPETVRNDFGNSLLALLLSLCLFDSVWVLSLKLLAQDIKSTTNQTAGDESAKKAIRFSRAFPWRSFRR